MYDSSGGGERLRRYAGCSLAWWHSYKWATKRIMIVYASDFIAPLFHYLFPTRQFDTSKFSHTAATTILSYIRLAYPRFKNSLQEQLANPVISVRQRTILQNLQHLCEFFIPVVCTVVVCDYTRCWKLHFHIAMSIFLLYVSCSFTHRFRTTMSACVSTTCPSQYRCCTGCLSLRLCFDR